MKDVVMFVKPVIEGYCLVTSFVSKGKVYIHEAFIEKSINELIDRSKNIISLDSQTYIISKVVFDASVFVQEGFYLRAEMNKDILIYTNKKKFEYRVSSQIDWVKDNFIFRKTPNESYAAFMNVFESYSNTDKYNLAMDILVDISHYYRYNTAC